MMCVVLLTVLVVGCAMPVIGSAATFPLQVDALSGHDYPWYDAKTGKLKALPLQEGYRSHSDDRSVAPLADKKTVSKNAPSAPANNTGGGGAATAGSADMGFVSTILIICVIAIILIILAVVLQKFFQIESSDNNSGRRSIRTLAESIEQLPFDLQETQGNFLSSAKNAYQTGDLQRAIIYLYSHVLLTLDQRGFIRLQKGKTSRQYLNEIRRHPSLANYFHLVLKPFEAAFFGDHEVTKDQFDNCWGQLDRFQREVDKQNEVLI